MKQLNEVARMQQLAGINEVKVNIPTHIDAPKLLNLISNINNYFEDSASGNDYEQSKDELFYDIGDEYGISFDYVDQKTLEKLPPQDLINIYRKILKLDIPVDLNK
jgi:hypothetical protein